jgi:2-polyprenyl-6-methoxyphenol hydroxylase-like FAD-dependent oxidoreductase
MLYRVAKTGAVLLPYAAQSSMAMAGQGIAGALVDAAVLAEPIDRVVTNYADQYGDWLLRR